MKVTDITSLARFILSEECKSICVLTGAGVSVASGIPDFRSPGGMYSTLNPDLLTASPYQRNLMKSDPTYVVTWDIFQNNQFPYMEVRKPFILGTHDHKWKATITHRFFELLHVKTMKTTANDNDSDDTTCSNKSKLTRIYTQNIDGLQQQCKDIPKDRIINVHGTISEVKCEGCGYDKMDYTEFCSTVESNIKDIYNKNVTVEEISKQTSKPILCPNCNKPLLKPNTVLFGRSLPDDFFIYSQKDMPTCDLLIVAGTSLVVSPANSLVYNVCNTAKRVIINNEQVGKELGINYNNNNNNNNDNSSRNDDYFAQGNCEDIFLNIIHELGWYEEFKLKYYDLLPTKSQELLNC